MTDYLAITLNRAQVYRILSLLECGDNESHQDWAIERELDSALLAQEMQVEDVPQELRDHDRRILLSHGINPAAVLEGVFDDE